MLIQHLSIYQPYKGNKIEELRKLYESGFAIFPAIRRWIFLNFAKTKLIWATKGN